MTGLMIGVSSTGNSQPVLHSAAKSLVETNRSQSSTDCVAKTSGTEFSLGSRVFTLFCVESIRHDGEFLIRYGA